MRYLELEMLKICDTYQQWEISKYKVVLPIGSYIGFELRDDTPLPLELRWDDKIGVIFPSDDVDFHLVVSNTLCPKNMVYDVEINEKCTRFILYGGQRWKQSALKNKGRKLRFFGRGVGKDKSTLSCDKMKITVNYSSNEAHYDDELSQREPTEPANRLENIEEYVCFETHFSQTYVERKTPPLDKTVIKPIEFLFYARTEPLFAGQT